MSNLRDIENLVLSAKIDDSPFFQFDEKQILRQNAPLRTATNKISIEAPEVLSSYSRLQLLYTLVALMQLCPKAGVIHPYGAAFDESLIFLRERAAAGEFVKLGIKV